MKTKLLNLTGLRSLLLLACMMLGMSVWGEKITFTFNTDEGLEALGIVKPEDGKGTELGDDSYVLGNASLTATTAEGKTATRIWNSKGITDLRIYEGSTLTISSSSDKITKIELSGAAAKAFTASEGTFSSGTWTGSAQSVTFTATNTGRINTIAVTIGSPTIVHAGTEADPYTVADARNAIDANTGVTGVYVKGIVCTGGSSLSNGAMNYWISDDGTTTDRFEIYKGKGLNGANFTSTDDVMVEDVVVVYGNIKKYNSTYEFDSGSKLISLERTNTTPVINAAASVEIAYDATDGKIEYTVANPVNGVALTATSTATWISNITVVDGAVTFETTKNEGSEDRTATFTLSYSGAEDVTVTVTQKHFVADYATLPFEFDGGKADIENTAGLTQEGLGSDYGSSPKLKFDGTGDYLILHFNERPGKLTFDIKGNPSSGSWEGKFTVQTSVDGETYTDLATYKDLTSTAQSEEFTNLGENVRYIKWILTEKVSGNVALGNIALAKYEEPEYYTLTVADAENVTISAAYGDEILVNGESAELESDTEVAVGLSIAEGYELESITATGSEEGQTVTLNPVANTKNAWTFNMPSYDVKINATVVKIVPFEEVKYTLATSITSGKRYIITDGEIMAMGKQNPNNRVAAEVTISDGVATVKSANVFEFVIESATIGEATGYSIYDESAESTGYLYAASSGSNHLKTQKENDVNGVWTITIDSEGLASIVAEGSSNRNVMQYNNGSSLFSCYASASQKPVYLFEKVEAPILLGDVNGDKEVTIADVVAIINYLLDPTSAKFNEAAANVDGQDGVTLADALAIINMIIGKQ
jgi:hypothetical protein